MLNLDTHVLVFALTEGLGEAERRVLKKNPSSISSIVLWEMAMLVRDGRIRVDLEDPEVLRRISALHVWPIDLAVSVQSTRLDFRSDPADELIAATSIVHKVPLLTRDKRMRASKLVPLA